MTDAYLDTSLYFSLQVPVVVCHRDAVAKTMTTEDVKSCRRRKQRRQSLDQSIGRWS